MLTRRVLNSRKIYGAVNRSSFVSLCSHDKLQSNNFDRKQKFLWDCNIRSSFLSSIADSRNEENEDDDLAVGSLERLLRVKPSIANEEDNELDDDEDDEDLIEEEGQSDPRERLARHLLKFSRIRYRHVEPYPEWFVKNQQEICSHRTAPQIRRCLKDWMIKNDRELHEKFKRKPLVWGETLSSEHNPTDVHEYGPEETTSYSFFFMPSRYQILCRLLKELRSLSPEFSPKRILDFGCGPATGAAAAFTTWESKKDALHKYTGIDMSQSMIDAGKLMTRGPDAIPDCVFWDKTSEVVRRAIANNERFDLAIISYTLTELTSDPARRAAVQLMFELLDVGGYLVIVEGGNPLGSHTVRTARQLVLDIFNNVDRTGEFDASPAYPVKPEQPEEQNSFRHFKQSKDKVTDSRKSLKKSSISMTLPAPPGYHYDELGAFVVAPCTHDAPCPLAGGLWCSFSQKVLSGMIRKSSEEKYSYVVIQKRPKLTKKLAASKKVVKVRDFGRWTDMTGPQRQLTESKSPTTAIFKEEVHPTPLQVFDRFAGVREKEDMVQLLDQLLDEVDWPLYNPPLYRQEWSRILRSPIKSRGHITMDVCNTDGLIQRQVLSKGNLIHLPLIFTAIRKATWGGLFPALRELEGGTIVETLKSPLTKTAKGVRVFHGFNQERDQELRKEKEEKEQRKKLERFGNTGKVDIRAGKRSISVPDSGSIDGKKQITREKNFKVFEANQEKEFEEFLRQNDSLVPDGVLDSKSFGKSKRGGRSRELTASPDNNRNSGSHDSRNNSNEVKIEEKETVGRKRPPPIARNPSKLLRNQVDDE